MDKEFASHGAVDHGNSEYVQGDVHVYLAENWFSQLKRGVPGTFHHVSEQYLDRYVDKFEFKYNNREIIDEEMARKAIMGTDGKRLI